MSTGEEPTLRGFYHGCGFNSAGMMFGGGCGWQLVNFDKFVVLIKQIEMEIWFFIGQMGRSRSTGL